MSGRLYGTISRKNACGICKKVVWFIGQLEAYVRSDSSRCRNSATRSPHRDHEILHYERFPSRVWSQSEKQTITVKSPSHGAKRIRSRTRIKVRNDDGNKSKKRRRPLSEHDGARWYIIPTDTWNEKWDLISVSLERRWSRKASRRVTKDEEVGCWDRVRRGTTPRHSVSLIITACVPAKITPFIHPRRVPALTRSANSSPFSSSIHLLSFPPRRRDVSRLHSILCACRTLLALFCHRCAKRNNL